MVKSHHVPDWLNSSLWSTATSADADPHSSSSSSSKYSTQVPIEPIDSETTSSIRSQIDSPPSPTVKHSPPPLVVIEETRGKEEESEVSRSMEDEIHEDEIPSAEELAKQSMLVTELLKKVINLKELRRLAAQGLTDAAGIRSSAWKLLLGYLPADRAMWPSELAKKRSQYKQFKDELLMNPSEIARRLEISSFSDGDGSNGESTGSLSRSHVNHGEHPLSLGKSSVWNQFFQDTEIIEQIDRDVKRTHPDMEFFSGDTAFARNNQEALRRILIIFAKLNPGIRYVQGMNEILAPIYYVFKNDPDEEFSAFAEADTFFCFVELLSGFRDNFCQQLDNSVVGIRSTISKLSQLLKHHDEELWRHLEITSKVNPQFYAFRWITLLLTQEFSFEDSLRIWDTLLSDSEGPQETLLRICCAMLILVRRRLLAGDFTSNLKLLQNYPSSNISHLLYVANKLRTQPPS